MKKSLFSFLRDPGPAADGTAFFTAVLFVVFCRIAFLWCTARFGVIFFFPVIAAALLLLLVIWLILPHKECHASIQSMLLGCSAGAILSLCPQTVQIFLLPICAAGWSGFILLRYTRKIWLGFLLALCVASSLFFHGNAVRAAFPAQQTEETGQDAEALNMTLYQHILVIAAEQEKVPEYYRWMLDANAAEHGSSSLEELIKQVQPEAVFPPKTKKTNVPDQIELLDFLYISVNPEPDRDPAKSFYFSEDFFRRVKILLNGEKGILAIVFPKTFTEEDRASALAALRNVFRRTAIFELQGTFVLASDSPDLTGDAAALNRRATGSSGIYSWFKAPEGLLAYLLPLREEQKKAHELLQAEALTASPARVNHPVLMHGKFWQYAYAAGPTFYFWASVLVAVYLLLRYFISWKPVHKKAFRSLESGFFSAGCILFCFFAMLNSIGEPQGNTLPACILAFSLSLTVQLIRRSHRRPGILTSILLPLLFLGLIWRYSGPPSIMCWFCLAVFAGEIRMAYFRLESEIQPEEPKSLIPMAGAGMLLALLIFPAGFLCDCTQTFGACLLAVLIVLLFYRENKTAVPEQTT